MNVTFNIIFWRGFDFEARKKNLQFTRKRLDSFVEFCCNRGINAKALVFDFSENQEIENSIHISYPNNEFRKSEKINKLLEFNKINHDPDTFCFLDSDIFFLEKDYNILFELIVSLQDKHIFQGNVLDVQNLHGIDFNNNTASNMQTKYRGVDGIGGFWIVKFNEVFSIGGYDERFTIWGGEDDNLVERMKNNGCITNKVPVDLYHLPHASLKNSAFNNPQYRTQCGLIYVNDTITQYSSITKKYLL